MSTTLAHRAEAVSTDTLEITVAYQPLVELRTQRLVGIEALARFPALTAQRMVLEAERTRRSATIDLAVLRHAIADLRADHAGALPLHVNVSPVSLARPSYVSAVRALLDVAPFAAERLVFEVTETSPLPRRAAVRRFAADIRGAGARIAVDDVPAGFDRMRAIGWLAPDVVKLDGDTLRRSVHDANARLRLEAACIMARDHRAVLVAEGIEEPAHVRSALWFGAEIGQGYLLGEPRCCSLSEVHPFQRS